MLFDAQVVLRDKPLSATTVRDIRVGIFKMLLNKRTADMNTAIFTDDSKPSEICRREEGWWCSRVTNHLGIVVCIDGRGYQIFPASLFSKRLRWQ